MYTRFLSIIFGLLITACGAVPASSISGSLAATSTPVPSPALPTPSPMIYHDPFNGKVDVGGYSLFLRCIGEGTPTIVFEAGGGDTGDHAWLNIWPELKASTRVCLYDRANLGYSDHAPPPRTIQDSVDDLHSLLNNAGISAPYVLVGHSWGGLIAQLYTRQHPDEVVGLVLVDSAHVDQFVRLDPLVPTPSADECPELKLWRPSTAPPNPELLDNELSIKQVRSAPPFPTNLPLMVLAAGRHYPSKDGCLPSTFLAQMNDQEMVLQDELPRLSTNSVYIVAERSRHFIQQDEPRLVIKAIAQVIEAARTQKPLKAP